MTNIKQIIDKRVSLIKETRLVEQQIIDHFRPKVKKIVDNNDFDSFMDLIDEIPEFHWKTYVYKEFSIMERKCNPNT